MVTVPTGGKSEIFKRDVSVFGCLVYSGRALSSCDLLSGRAFSMVSWCACVCSRCDRQSLLSDTTVTRSCGPTRSSSSRHSAASICAARRRASPSQRSHRGPSTPPPAAYISEASAQTRGPLKLLYHRPPLGIWRRIPVQQTLLIDVQQANTAAVLRHNPGEAR